MTQGWNLFLVLISPADLQTVREIGLNTINLSWDWWACQRPNMSKLTNQTRLRFSRLSTGWGGLVVPSCWPGLTAQSCFEFLAGIYLWILSFSTCLWTIEIVLRWRTISNIWQKNWIIFTFDMTTGRSLLPTLANWNYFIWGQKTKDLMMIIISLVWVL